LAIASTFLPAILDEPSNKAQALRSITTLPVRFVGLGIPNPKVTAARNYATSREMMDPLTLSITTGTELGAHSYAKTCVGTRKMQQKRKEQAATNHLKNLSMAA